MSSQGHQKVELAGVVQDVDQGAEQERQRQRASVVGDEHQHFLMRKAAVKTPVKGFEHHLLIEYFPWCSCCLDESHAITPEIVDNDE